MKWFSRGSIKTSWRDGLVVVWLVVLYVVTAVTARLDTNLSPPVLEVRNIIIHSVSYAFLSVLVAFARHGFSRGWARSHTLTLLGFALCIGIGQEALQSILRGQISFFNSMFDLGVDTAGAAAGWVAFRRVLKSASRQGRAGTEYSGGS